MRRTGAVAVALTVAVAAFAGGCNGEKQAGAERRGPRPVSVRAAQVERGELQVISEYPGELFADAVDLAPRLPGRLASVPVRLGDKVKEGQLLAKLDDAELTHQLDEAEAALKASQARGRQASANLELARSELRRKAPLAADQLVSAQELAELQARVAGLEAQSAAAEAEAAQARARMGLLKKQLADTRITAPFAGTISERRLEPGAAVGPTTPVVRLVAEGPLQVRFRVPERDLAVLREGQPLQVRAAATGDSRHPGKVSRTGTEVSRTDRAVQVEGVLDEEKGALLAGMFATVELRERTLPDALLVPSAAVLERNEGGEQSTGVFIAEGDAAQWKRVEPLGSRGGRTAVKAELQPGDLVLTLGHEELSSGSPIRVVTPAQEGQSPAAPGTGGAAQKGANG